MIAFGTLLGEAKAAAQRNATELATYLATAMALAGEEVSENGDREPVRLGRLGPL